MPVPLSELESNSYDNAYAMTNVSSNVCTMTYVTTVPIVSGKSYVSPKPISDSYEPSGKRSEKERSGSLDLLCEVLVKFQPFLDFTSSHSWLPMVITFVLQLITPGLLLPLSIRLFIGSPGKNKPVSPAHLTCSTSSTCFNCSSSLAHLTCLPNLACLF